MRKRKIHQWLKVLKERKEARMVYIMLAAAIFILDLWIKNRAEKTLKRGESRRLFGGKFLLRLHHNRGAVLNLGEKRPFAVAAVSVILTAFLAVGMVLSLGEKGNRLLRTGLSFMLGGAFSNTYDRLRRRYVIDYLSFGTAPPKLRKIVYNISDFFIMAGAVLTIIGAV